MKSMFLGKVYLLGLIGALLTLICCSGGCIVSKRGKAIESWETTNGYFKIRVVAYKEDISYGLQGTFYVYSSSLAKEDSWAEVLVYRHDDDPPIPRDNVRFVSDQTGYIFIDWMYAVTTDAGKTWSVWDATKKIPDWDGGYKYGGIRDVQLSPDGNGLMIMRPNDDPRRKDIIDIQFRTNDFGRHWDRNR